MTDYMSLQRLMRWGLFVLLALAVVLGKALPLGTSSWPGPDLVFVLAASWVLRRPDYVPFGLVAAVFLLVDLLQMRPPGLTALANLLVIEFMRSRAETSREWPFVVEWGVFAGLAFASVFAQHLVLFLMVVPQQSFGADIQQLISGLLAFPLAVAFSVYLLGIRRPRLVERGVAA